MENRYIITMDIKKGTILNARFKQGDTDSSVLEVKLIDNGVFVDITGQDIEFNFLRPDGIITTQDATNGVSILDAMNGKFQCILKNSTLSVAGNARCDIIFAKDGKELSTKTFNFTIDDKINSGLLSIASINAKIVEWQTEIDEMKEAYENATHENSLLEVVNARSGEVDLATKINKIDSSLSDIPNQSYIVNKASIIYVDTKFGNMGNTKTYKGSCTNAELIAKTGMLVDDYWYISDLATNKCYNGTVWGDIGNNLKIGDNTIGESKLNYTPTHGVPSKNKFNKNSATLGKYLYVDTGGLFANDVAQDTSDFIDVLSNTIYISNKNLNILVYYDIDKNYISGFNNKIQFTTPVNCKYIRETTYASYTSILQIEQGTTATSFEPFGNVISQNYLTNEMKSKLESIDSTKAINDKNLFNKLTTTTSTSLMTWWNEHTMSASFVMDSSIKYDYIFFKNLKAGEGYAIYCDIYYVYNGVEHSLYTKMVATWGENNATMNLAIVGNYFNGLMVLNNNDIMEFYALEYGISNQTLDTVYRINPNLITNKALNKSLLNNNPIIYADMHKKIPRFVKHYYAKDKDVTVVLQGDSYATSFGGWSSEKNDSAYRPPLTQYNNFGGSLWDKIKWDGQIYRRYDAQDNSINTFTEVGSFTTVTDTAEWGDVDGANSLRPAHTRISNSNVCSVSYKIPVNYVRSGFIYRSELNGCDCKITVAEGNGYLTVWNGTNWVEANNYIMTMEEVQVNAYCSNSVYQKRIKFKCVNTHLDVVKNVTIEKTSTGAERFSYWGIEHSLDDNMLYFLITARGSHTHSALWQHIQNDVYDFKPDLILHEIPVINDISPNNGLVTPLEIGVNTMEHYLFDTTFDMSYISKSNNFTDFEVISYLPYITGNLSSFNILGEWLYWNNSVDGVVSVRDYYNTYIKYFIDNPTYNFVNTFDRFITESKKYGNLYSMVQESGLLGTSFATGGHPNDFGNAIYSKYLLPLFDFYTT